MVNDVFFHEDYYRQIELIPEENYFKTLRNLGQTPTDEKNFNGFSKMTIRDCTMDKVMEELCSIRHELKAIGININQMTRVFNTYPEHKRREISARLSFQKYMAIEAQVDRLLETVSKLAVKWLSSDKP
jgi:Bacterial mobilisation protein (MobC).